MLVNLFAPTDFTTPMLGPLTGVYNASSAESAPGPGELTAYRNGLRGHASLWAISGKNATAARPSRKKLFGSYAGNVRRNNRAS